MSFGAMLANAAEQERNRRMNQSQFDRRMDLAEEQFNLGKKYSEYDFNRMKDSNLAYDEGIQTIFENIEQENLTNLQKDKVRNFRKKQRPTLWQTVFGEPTIGDYVRGRIDDAFDASPWAVTVDDIVGDPSYQTITSNMMKNMTAEDKLKFAEMLNIDPSVLDKASNDQINSLLDMYKIEGVK